MRGVLILLVFALGGPILAWQGYKHRQFRAQLAAEGTTVQAEAHGGELRTGKHSSAKLEVSYQAEGRMIHKTMPVSAKFMKSISNDDSLTVDSVSLTYLKSDPEQAIIVDGTPDTSPNLWIGAIAALIGWGGGATTRTDSQRRIVERAKNLGRRRPPLPARSVSVPLWMMTNNGAGVILCGQRLPNVLTQ